MQYSVSGRRWDDADGGLGARKGLGLYHALQLGGVAEDGADGGCAEASTKEPRMAYGHC